MSNEAPIGRGSANRTPRWVKVFGVIGGIVVVAFVVLHLTGNMSALHGSGAMPAIETLGSPP